MSSSLDNVEKHAYAQCMRSVLLSMCSRGVPMRHGQGRWRAHHWHNALGSGSSNPRHLASLAAHAAKLLPRATLVRHNWRRGGRLRRPWRWPTSTDAPRHGTDGSMGLIPSWTCLGSHRAGVGLGGARRHVSSTADDTCRQYKFRQSGLTKLPRSQEVIND